MIHGRVIGELWATVKLASLTGRKLLVVRPEGADPAEDVVAVDLLGAGRGERVVVARGQAARLAVGDAGAALEAAVVAIVDDADIDADAMLDDDDEPPQPVKKKPATKKKAAKKKASRKKASRKAKEPEPPEEAVDETGDLFAAEEAELAAAEASSGDESEEVEDYRVEIDPDADGPGIADVDAIWGEDEDEDSESGRN